MGKVLWFHEDAILAILTPAHSTPSTTTTVTREAKNNMHVTNSQN